MNLDNPVGYLLDGERRLAAIMFTDLVGYTALGQKNESLSLALVEEQRKLVRPILSRHHGREVKTIGDGFLVEFHSALDAVRCAYEIQRAAREFNVSIPAEQRIRLRAGIHLGDVVESRDDISGDAVNVASRIESLAEDGGVCLTRQVYDQVQNKFQLPFLSLGAKTLKNVSAPLEVFKMIMPWEQEKVLVSADLDKRRIAVLPLTNISADSADEYFADGMTEELIATMSRIGGLKVIARTSVMGYKGGQKKISEVARELQVGSVLEGSVRRAGDRVRITVQLIDAPSNEHVWAESYDRELKDIFAIQSEISKAVAEQLKVQLMSAERAVIEKRQTVDPGAFALYLKGRYFWNERTKENVEKAQKYFEQAVKLDPDFALAYSGLADCYSILADFQWMAPSKAGPLARHFSMKALSIDENLAEAHASLALTLMNHFWDFSGAERELERAIELRPNYAPAYHWYATMLGIYLRWPDAYSVEKRAAEIDPYSRIITTGMSTLLAIQGRTDEAIEGYKQIIELNPDFAVAHGWKCMVHSWRGEHNLAVVEAKKAMELDRNPFLESILAWVQARAGRNDEAERILKHLMSRSSKEYVSPTWIGLAELALGRTDEGLRWLEKSLAEKDPSLLYFAGLPWFKEYRSGPRWERIDGKIGRPAKS